MLKSSNALASSYRLKTRGVCVSYAYREKLEGLGVRISMGSRGSCYDNAAMESLNGIIKTEALYSQFGKAAVNGKRIQRKDIVRREEWFIGYYNSQRCKKCLGKLPPVTFREQNPHGTYLALVETSGC